MSESQAARRVENVAPIAGRAASLNVAAHESHVVSEALEDLGRSRFATPRDKELIRSIGKAVDADRESFVNKLLEKGFTLDRNWIRVRRMLVLMTWILCGTTRGAWEGWNANEMWEKCKKLMQYHKSAVSYQDYLMTLTFAYPPHRRTGSYS
ncbi:hypothetical protein N7481_001858 [Penicillium waksmanii]|uniref:uncharacterized protein n=1 Tax=Penicillium waksmanii TaxID=69791 RepID=UPI0025478ED9|nr:uncharacterized protein N7481_001858 [Penicillium waksmanii]KAJ5994881.1 hypothetical protein N7481_001858 [Penicillium waksmanii]